MIYSSQGSNAIEIYNIPVTSLLVRSVIVLDSTLSIVIRG